MGIKYLWDTNIVIYYLQQQFDATTGNFIDNLLNDGLPAISVITEIELLCWKTTDEKDYEILKNFIDDIAVIELEQSVKNKTAEIRKQNKIKLPDAIIAATAIVHNLILVTRNASDFKNIPELQLINPWE